VAASIAERTLGSGAGAFKTQKSAAARMIVTRNIVQEKQMPGRRGSDVGQAFKFAKRLGEVTS